MLDFAAFTSFALPGKLEVVNFVSTCADAMPTIITNNIVETIVFIFDDFVATKLIDYSDSAKTYFSVVIAFIFSFC